MDDIIASGSAAATASPGFYAQEDIVELDGGMDDRLDYSEEEPEKEEEDDDEEEDPVLAMATKGKKKRKRAAMS